MSPAQLLLLSILLPIGGALLIASIGSVNRRLVRRLALGVSLATLLLVLLVTAAYDSADDYRFQEQLQAARDGQAVSLEATPASYAASEYTWLRPESGIDVRLSLGLDGLSLWLYALSALLMLTSVLVSWEAIDRRPALFYSLLLLLEAGCLGVFAARDIVVFYIFFEFTLIPLFFLIGIWGSEQRRYAAIKFFLYTLAGSLLTFLGLLTIVLWVDRQADLPAVIGSIPQIVLLLQQHPMPLWLQTWVFVALFAGFAIKVPLFPLHTWLPLAHVQAPTAGSVFLAGILLKIGTYGFARFSMPMLPDATARLAPWLIVLAVVGIVYGALVALVQRDIKRMIAYSSVSHLGFCMLGLFALNAIAVQGATLQMVNHGISTGALFALVGMLYERYHSRQIADFGGLARRLPILSFFMLLFTFSSIGLPGLNGFAGEIMILIGAFQRGWAQQIGHGAWVRWAAVLAVSGVVLGAWYMLWLVQRVFFGPLREPVREGPADLNVREIAALAPLAVLVFWIGLYPQYFLRPMAPALHAARQMAAARLDEQAAEETRRKPVAALQGIARSPGERATGGQHRVERR